MGLSYGLKGVVYLEIPDVGYRFWVQLCLQQPGHNSPFSFVQAVQLSW